MAITRRTFIKIGGGATAAAAASSGLMSQMWGLMPSQIHDPETAGDKVVPTFCEICFWKCGVLAHVRDGRVTKITGNPEHPLSAGRLCPRGTGGTGLLYDPDRLKTPLLRREKRGEQVFEAVSWEVALDHIAEKLQKLAKEHGPESLALWSHGYGGSWFKHLAKAYGTANVTAPSYAQCRGSREAAFELTFGAPVGSPEVMDLENARVIVLLGSHLGENMHNTQVQELAKSIDAGGELVVVDPRFSVAAGKARHWLPIKPGTDIALLLAWAHVMLREGLHDKAWLDKNAIGLDKLQAHVQDKTPEWAWAQTGIEPQQIVETARFIAGAGSRAVIHPGRRTAWYGDDTQRGRAIAIVNALLGNWGRRGGFYIPDTFSVPGYKGSAKPVGHPPAPADMPAGVVYPFASKTLAHGLRDASLPAKKPGDKGPAIKAWMVYGTNLIQALPQPELTIEAIKALDFMVAIDVLPMEITGWADVVLPEATYLERYDDLHTPPFKRGFVALRQPVVEPLHQSKPGWWIARELGNRMGFKAFFPWNDVTEYLKARLDQGGLSFEDLKRKGVLLGPPAAITEEDGVQPTFATPSKKVEIYSEQLAAAGLDPLPNYTPPEQAPPGHLLLLWGRTPTHTFGRTTNNRFLSQMYDENELWLNDRSALESGLKNGEQVAVVHQDGHKVGPIRLKATRRIRPGCVYMVHGYGHSARDLRFARGRGASDSELVRKTRIDPVMGGTGMNVNFVRIEKWTA